MMLLRKNAAANTYAHMYGDGSVVGSGGESAADSEDEELTGKGTLHKAARSVLMHMCDATRMARRGVLHPTTRIVY